MFKYEPSAGVLDETYQRLLKLRDELREEQRRTFREAPSPGFGVFDDEDFRSQQQKHMIDSVKVDSQLELVNNLLRPFEAEARYWHEQHEKRACERMMRI